MLWQSMPIIACKRFLHNTNNNNNNNISHHHAHFLTQIRYALIFLCSALFFVNKLILMCVIYGMTHGMHVKKILIMRIFCHFFKDTKKVFHFRLDRITSRLDAWWAFHVTFDYSWDMFCFSVLFIWKAINFLCRLSLL